MAMASVVSAAIYDAGGGADFRISYSDDWYRVPHGVVSDFLESQGLNDSTFNYSAVLASRENPKFFLGSYIFLCHEPAGLLNNEQIEAVLYMTSEEYGKSYVLGSLNEFAGGSIQNGQPMYDKDLKIILTKSEIAGSGGSKILLEMKKVYEKGIAIFLCYSSPEKYLENEPVFFDIIRSFSYKANNISTAEDIQEPADAEVSRDESSGLGGSLVFWIICILTIILALVIIKRKTGKN